MQLGLQVEQELAEERAAAEIEAHRAQEAIQAKQQELQRIEQQRQYEVCPLLSWLLETTCPQCLVLFKARNWMGWVCL